MIAQILAGLAGLLFSGWALRALRTGDFTAAKRVVWGNYVGTEHIRRQERPVAFWFCVSAFLGFGVAILGCAWFIL